MPKKRGRPPKSPNPKTPDPSSSTNVETQKQGLDLLELDEEDLADIDGLSPKQAEKLLRNLDVIRTKLQGKSSEASMKVADNNQKVHNKEAETKENICRFQHIDPRCALCMVEIETRDHLFFECHWSRQLLEILGDWIRLDSVFYKYKNWTKWVKYGFQNRKRQQVVIATIAACIYSIWMERNRRFFTNQSKHPFQVFSLVKKELSYRFNVFYDVQTLVKVHLADRVLAEI
ncbi:hypothetical protein RIF29_10279 [Crotalaria pallida]|uniref:Reverse transcriptase zinc-binding domain-containing protein n=1 Tax=Crotalaria pallida TaxID=3830 RepID=A0AAN9FSM3_CROPI